MIKNSGWNANIEPGQTLELGFAGNPGNVDKEPSNYKLSYIGQHEQNDEKEDEPKDTDEDELNNLEEYLVGTNPYSEDTDCDGLKDGEEAHEYETDPLLYDTDKDGIRDGDEIKLGLNPLSQYTHGNTLDSEYQIDQTIAVEDININEEEDKYKFSLDVTASGCIESNMYIVSSAYDDVVQVNDAILGGVLDLMYTGGDVTEATLKFQVEESYIDNGNSEYAVIAEENNSVGYCNMLGAYAYIDMTGYEKVYIRFRYKVGQATKFEPIPTWHEEEIYIQYDLSERFTTHVYQGTSQWDEEKYPSKFSVLKVVWGKGDERFGVILKDFNDIYIDDFEVYGTKRGESSELRATIEAPEILALTPTKEVYNPNPFEIKFNIENLKNSAVKNVKAVLSLPEGVTLVEGNKEISIDTLDAHAVDSTIWKVMVEPSTVDKKNMKAMAGQNTGDKQHEFVVTYHADGIPQQTAQRTIKIPRKFNIISSTGLTPIELEAPLIYGSLTDTDEDTLPDSKEVNWYPYSGNRENERLDVNYLPTIAQCINMGKPSYVEEGLNRIGAKLENIATSTYILPILSDPTQVDGDKDGTPDLIDDEKLKKNTIETMFPLPNNNKRTNAVYINIDDNNISLTVHVDFDGDANDKFPNTQETYGKIIEEAIEDIWSDSILGTKYDFFPHLKGYLSTRVISVFPGKEHELKRGQKYVIVDVKNKKNSLPSTSTATGGWSVKNPSRVLITRYSKMTPQERGHEEYKITVAHEFGHVFGLKDAYYKDDEKDFTPITSEIPAKDLVRLQVDQWPYCLTNNDIEMVLQAFVENKMQHFYINSFDNYSSISKVIRLKP